MTGHYCDYQNADVILTCGSNNVENHPVSAKWIQKALDRGATWIVVDPRYTRTAACADIYSSIRSGTDIAFYGGMFNYIIENGLWQDEYVKNYTNAAYLLDPNFKFDAETGMFSGWNEETHSYDTTSWGYQIDSTSKWDTSPKGVYSWASASGVPEFVPPEVKAPKMDMTLQDPNCVFQVFKRHYARYDMDTVCAITGMEKDKLELIYKTYAATGAPEKSGTILYALGQTQHHYGAQNCRAMSLVQLLLGNVGVAGGGVNAMRGEPNVQGATDMALLVWDYPGYLKMPAQGKHDSLKMYLERETQCNGYYTNKPKFWVSALKEFYGANATEANDYCYDLMPKVGGKIDYSTISTFEHMDTGLIKGYWLWGQNPLHSTPNSSFALKAMSKLEWLVCTDWVETESATFWKAPGMKPEEIDTTVYMLPAALIYEKDGTIANSGRWLQWRYKALEPAAKQKADLEILDLLWKEIRSLYEKEGGVCADQILKVNWDYDIDGKVDARKVAWALNGYNTADGSLLKNFTQLTADGSTACGIWIYSGYYNNNADPENPASQPVGARSKEDKSGIGLYSDWAFAWPVNRRILYNRASCDMNGKPWNPERTLVSWNGKAWDTVDVPDFGFQKPNPDGTATPIPPNNKAFMMTWEQNARLICSTMKDAAMPEHYEPFESPTKNVLNGSQNSPCIKFTDYKSVKKGDAKKYPIVATTYSVVEHWQTGSQTRSCPALVEAMPSQFIEMSEELAAEKGIKNGDKVRVFNNRGSVEIDALVTCRLAPMVINGETVHQVGMTHHWGWAGKFAASENVVNDLTPNVGDPNCYVPEYKAFLVDVEKA